jgi:hypothetical protein
MRLITVPWNRSRRDANDRQAIVVDANRLTDNVGRAAQLVLPVSCETNDDRLASRVETSSGRKNRPTAGRSAAWKSSCRRRSRP